MSPKKIENIDAIFWDWNGTLLNDVMYSVDCINVLHQKRNLKTLNIEAYKDVFTFPVQDYYERIGFDFTIEKWESVAMEFMSVYWRQMNDLALFEDVWNVLEMLKLKNIRQFVISAMEHKMLMNMLERKGVMGYFENVQGISDHYAVGKAHLGQQIMRNAGLCNHRILWIGDTVHDFDVSNELGIPSVLVSCGHQSEKVLFKTNTSIYTSLTDVFEGI